MMHVAKLLMMKGIPSVSKVAEGVLAAGEFVVASVTDDGRGVQVENRFSEHNFGRFTHNWPLSGYTKSLDNGQIF